MKLNAYLNFNGHCETALNFYATCLGGKVVAMMKFSGSPMCDQMPPEMADKVMHGRIMVGDQVLMASDVTDYVQPAGFSVTVNVEAPEEADRVFHALAEGGKIDMPIAETFWARRFGMLTDRFGIAWMVNCEKPMA